MNPADPTLWLQGGALGILGLLLFALVRASAWIANELKATLGAIVARFTVSADRFDAQVVKFVEAYGKHETANERRSAAMADVIVRSEHRIISAIQREALSESKCATCGERMFVRAGGTEDLECHACMLVREARAERESTR